MGDGKLYHHLPSYVSDNVTGMFFFFPFAGVDHTVRSGRVSWRCRVLWLDGARCNEAYHGARIVLHIGMHYLSFRRALIHFSFSAARPWVAWACPFVFPALTPRSPSFSHIGAGYLIGPILGSNLWRVTHRRTMALIEERDREFHRHIVRNRVDPRAQSATNPVPDFYGEQVPDPVYDMYRSISLQERKSAPCINIDRSD